MKGVTIILMKGYNGKSRLTLDHEIRRRLVDSLASDLYKTITDISFSNEPWNCFIATPDKFFSEKCKKEKIPILDLEIGDLNFIFHQIQNWVVENGYDFLILCAGDIPLLDGLLIYEIKRRLRENSKGNGKSMIVCPSKSNGVSIIGMSPVDLCVIAAQEGLQNLEIIMGLDHDMYPYEIINDFRSYMDIDYHEDLYVTLRFMEENSAYENRLVKEILSEIFYLKPVSCYLRKN